MVVPVWILIGIRWLLVASLLLGVIFIAVALSLSVAAPRAWLHARVAWFIAALSLWAVVCLFQASLLSGWPNAAHEVTIGTLALPTALAALGVAVGALCMRRACRVEAIDGRQRSAR